MIDDETKEKIYELFDPKKIRVMKHRPTGAKFPIPDGAMGYVYTNVSYYGKCRYIQIRYGCGPRPYATYPLDDGSELEELLAFIEAPKQSLGYYLVPEGSKETKSSIIATPVQLYFIELLRDYCLLVRS